MRKQADRPEGCRVFGGIQVSSAHFTNDPPDLEARPKSRQPEALTHHSDCFETTVACRGELPVIRGNEWQRFADRLLNDDRRGKVNSVESSNCMSQNKLFCLSQHRHYRFDKLPNNLSRFTRMRIEL